MAMHCDLKGPSPAVARLLPSLFCAGGGTSQCCAGQASADVRDPGRASDSHWQSLARSPLARATVPDGHARGQARSL
eukprot:148085-Rhodomonas_salina.1